MLLQDEDSTEQKSTKEEVVEDVDLFAKTDETDTGQNNDNEEEEEDLLAMAKSSSAAKPPSHVKGSSIFGTNDSEDVDDEDINNLFVPAGAEEKKNIGIKIEDNSQLLK